MGKLLINSGELLSHDSEDGEILTRINGVVMEKNLLSFTYGNARDTLHQPAGKLLAVYTESGTLTESGGKLDISAVDIGAGIYSKSANTVLTFGDGTWEVEVDNWSRTGATYLSALFIYVDDNNYARAERINNGSINQIRWILRQGGVNRDVQSFNTASTNFKLKIQRIGNDWFMWYEVTGSFVQLSNDVASANRNIGAAAIVKMGDATTGTVGSGSSDYLYLNMTGTNVFWDQKSDTSAIKDTFNTQVLGVGTTIQFGTADWTGEGLNMTYDYKIGTGSWVLGRTSAQITALGDQVTDDGNFDFRAVYGGSTSTASWTKLEADTIAGGTPIFKSAVLCSKILQGVA